MTRRIPSCFQVLLFLVASACQSYEFEPVEPRAVVASNDTWDVAGTRLPPNVMLVVDRSGSMDAVSQGGNGGLDDVKAVFATSGGFLDTNRDLARWGLVLFGGDSDPCSPGTVQTAIGGNVDTIRNQINAASAETNTPTASTMEGLLRVPEFAQEEPGRSRFAMLLTDGMPNCPDGFDARCAECNNVGTVAACWGPGKCNSTVATVDSGGNPTDYECVDYYGGDAPYICLDDDRLVAAIDALARAGVKTFVIGFGNDVQTNPVARDVLNRAAGAGGLARSDPTYQFYTATNRTELGEVLRKFGSIIQTCSFTLSPPPASSNLLQVVLLDTSSGTETRFSEGADWTLDTGTGVLKLSDAKCAYLSSLPPDRYKLQFRYVSSL